MLKKTEGDLIPDKADIAKPHGQRRTNELADTTSAGLTPHTTRSLTFSDVPSAEAQLVQHDQDARYAVDQDAEKRNYTWVQTASDAIKNTITGAAVQQFSDWTAGSDNETTLTPETWEQMVKEAQDAGLPNEWLEELEDVETVEEFQRVFGRSMERIQVSERLNASWGGVAANLLANALDPVNIPLGAGVVNPILRASRAAVVGRNIAASKAASVGLATSDTVAKVARSGRLQGYGASALAGGAGGLVSTAAFDALGHAPPGSEYISAAALGVFLGAAFGPLANKAATQEEARMLALAANRVLRAKTYDQAMKELGVKPPMIDPLPALPHPDQFKITTETPPGQPFHAKTGDDIIPGPTVKPKHADPERVFEVQIEALRLHVEDAKAQLKGMKRGSPEAEAVRLAAVSANKEMALLTQQLDAYRANGKLPDTMMVEEPSPGTAPLDPELARRISELRDNLAKATDPETAAELRSVLDEIQGFIANAGDDLDSELAAALLQRQAAAMRLRGALERGEEAVVSELEARIRQLDDLLSEHTDELVPEAQAAGAAPTPEELTGHDFIDDNAVRALKVDAIDEAALVDGRYDRASVVSRTKNPLRRLLGFGLLDESVGMKNKDNASAFSADLDSRQIKHRWLTPYEAARELHFKEWANAMGYNFARRHTARDEFYIAIGRRIRNLPPAANHPQAAQVAVEKMLPHVDRLGKEFAKASKNPMADFGKVAKPLPGADEWEARDGIYMTNRWDANKIQHVIEEGRLSETGLIRLISDAIEKAQPGINKRYLSRLASGFAINVRNRAFGVEDEWTISLTSRDRRRFAAALTRDTGLSPDEVEDLVKTIFDRKPGKSGVDSSHKGRVLMDYTHVDKASGVGVGDLLDLNVDRLFQAQAHRLSGRVALARMQIRAPKRPRMRTTMARDPKTGNTITTTAPELDVDGKPIMDGGDVIIDGIRTDDEFEAILQKSRQWSAQNGYPEHPRTRDREEKLLRWTYDRLMGRPDPVHAGGAAQAMRNARDYSFMRLMWQVPFSMLNEYVLPAAALGVKAGTQHAPAWKRVVDAAGNWRYQRELAHQIESMGIGPSRHHKASLRGFEHFQENPDAPLTNSRWDRFTEKMAFGAHLTAQYSGMSSLQAILEVKAASSILQRLADMAETVQAGKKLGKADMERWKALGLDDDLSARIFENFKHATKERGVFFGSKLMSLNLDKWDAATSMALQQIVFRYSRKLIQQQSYGNTAMWMGTPLAMTVFQFRNFPFTAYNNHLLHNLHMRDAAAVRMFVFGTTWAAMVHGVRIKMLAALRPDREEYEEKNLNKWELAKAGFSRSSYASISPMVIDTLLYLLDRPGMFQARSTGQASDLIFGSPIGSAGNSAADVIGGFTGSWIDNRQMSQQEIRGAINLLPGATIPLMQGLGHLIKDRPVRAPRVQSDW